MAATRTMAPTAVGMSGWSPATTAARMAHPSAGASPHLGLGGGGEERVKGQHSSHEATNMARAAWLCCQLYRCSSLPQVG